MNHKIDHLFLEQCTSRVGFLLSELHKRPTADGIDKSKAQTSSFFLFHVLHIVQSAVEWHGGNDASVQNKELASNTKRVPLQLAGRGCAQLAAALEAVTGRTGFLLLFARKK